MIEQRAIPENNQLKQNDKNPVLNVPLDSDLKINDIFSILNSKKYIDTLIMDLPVQKLSEQTLLTGSYGDIKSQKIKLIEDELKLLKEFLSSTNQLKSLSLDSQICWFPD